MCEMRNSSLLGKITILFVICCCCLPAQGKYGGGTGEPNDPYLIYDANQMNAIGADANDWDKHFKLMADIDLSGFTGTSFNIIGQRYYDGGWVRNPFTGVFDGNGHTISNFSYTSTDTAYVGLFGYVDYTNAEIRNLGLINAEVEAGTGNNVGSLVGSLCSGTINGCYVEGGTVSGASSVGGLVGFNFYGTINNCYSSGSVTGCESVGGLVGVHDLGSTITNSCATGNVTGTKHVGGLVGYNEEGTITNCYARGGVTGDDHVGGLVGLDNYGTIINCYSTGSIEGDNYVGGLVGSCVHYRMVFASFWDTETSGLETSARGTGKTTAELQTTSTFIGWGCEAVWTIDDGNDYPGLWWENKPGKIITNVSYGGGSGEPNDPYLIYTAEHLNMIGWILCDWDKHFKLMADVDLGQFTREEFNIIGYYRSSSVKKPFIGVFDGNGHTIYNFSYTSTDKSRIGLFSYVEGLIKDLRLVDPDVNGGTGLSVGSLVGRLWVGTITNCYVDGGNVSGTKYVGGLVGLNSHGTIKNCYARCTVMGNDYVGGLVGSNSGTVTDCYSTGSVEGVDDVGGLVGGNGGTIINSYASGGVLANEEVGGLVGRNSYGTITNCYSTGSVAGDNDVGGLVGDNYKGTVTTSFWDIETSGQNTSAGGTGKTTLQMQDPNTFIDAGWDFVGEYENGPSDIWAVPESGGYPVLWWQLSPLPLLPSFSGGSGTTDDPYLISTTTDLNRIGHNPRLMGAHFKSIRDIDLAGLDLFIIGNEAYPYSGVFDGNGHTISNFTYTSTDRNYVGLFVLVTGVNAEIRNLGLIDPNIDAGTGYSVGSMVGLLGDATITNCYVEGGSVSGNDRVGGLVGENFGTITSSYSEVCVSGTKYVGGLAGENMNTITNCYSMGSVSGDIYVGGLVAYSFYYSTVTKCYSTGSVSGNGYVGGLVGYCYEEVSDSFWDIETSGQTTSAGGTGLKTEQMQTASTFAGWGCGSIWTIDSGKDYPRLWWQNIPGEIISKPYYGGGNGEPNDPYLIYTAEQLNTIGLVTCDLDKHFRLMADIDLSSITGTSFNIIGTFWANPFTGVFDGKGHTISNFTYTYTSTYYIGLFGYVRGVIKDLGLIDPNVDGGTGRYVGSLVGMVSGVSGGAVTGCYVKGGSVSGHDRVGGMVGYNSGTITNCYSTGSVSGYDYVGGLVGENSGTIRNCYAKGGSVSGNNVVGGLVGDNYWNGKITNCYSTGSASGTYGIGGLVGKNWDGTISKSYAFGSVSGTRDVGGLVGYNRYGSVTASFWDIETSGQTSSAGGTGLTTAEMQMMSTFTDAGWDFVGEKVNGIEDIWFIPQVDYPHLWWEGMQVPMKLTPRTLNCRSKGNWVKAHLTLPQGFTVEDVNANRPAVLHSFGFQSLPLYVFVNKDKLVEIEAAFEREAVCSLTGNWPQMLTVAGFLTDGNIFLGTSTVRIIHPGMKVIEELAWYWLNEDCVHPTWCDRIDMNRDSLVNLLDYALLMNINVEFVTDE